MIDYEKLESVHKLASKYQLLSDDDVSISVVFRSNYTKYSLISGTLDESYTGLDGLRDRLKKLIVLSE